MQFFIPCMPSLQLHFFCHCRLRTHTHIHTRTLQCPRPGRSVVPCSWHFHPIQLRGLLQFHLSSLLSTCPPPSFSPQLLVTRDNKAEGGLQFLPWSCPPSLPCHTPTATPRDSSYFRKPMAQNKSDKLSN